MGLLRQISLTQQKIPLGLRTKTENTPTHHIQERGPPPPPHQSQCTASRIQSARKSHEWEATDIHRGLTLVLKNFVESRQSSVLRTQELIFEEKKDSGRLLLMPRPSFFLSPKRSTHINCQAKQKQPPQHSHRQHLLNQNNKQLKQ